MPYGIAIGYYVTCDDAVCADCAPDGYANSDYSQWPGFEGWEEPIAIFDDAEGDTPTHCYNCGGLIAHNITSAGADCIAEHIGSALGDTEHDVSIVSQWWDEYGDGLDEDQLRDIITEALGQRSKHKGEEI